MSASRTAEGGGKTMHYRGSKYREKKNKRERRKKMERVGGGGNKGVIPNPLW